MIDFNNIWIDIECPRCRYIFEIQIIDVKTERKVFCHNCKSTIELLDSNASTHSSIDNITNSIKKLEKTLKNLGK